MADQSAALFKNSRAEAVYMENYAECLQQWGVPFTERTVTTNWGVTTVYICGPEKAPALVLLHGLCVASPSWYPHIAALAAHYRVYAFDYNGDLGKSAHERPPADLSEAADWFHAVCAGLGIHRTAVAGMSFGAYLAVNAVLKNRERIIRLIIISPAGVFAPLNRAFMIKMISSSLLPFRFIRLGFLKWLHAPGNFRYNAFANIFMSAIQYGRPQLRFPPSAFTDEELKQLQLPVLFLIGEQEVVINPGIAVERARALVKDIRVEIISRAGHALPVEQTQTVNKHILNFLKE